MPYLYKTGVETSANEQFFLQKFKLTHVWLLPISSLPHCKQHVINNAIKFWHLTNKMNLYGCTAVGGLVCVTIFFFNGKR